jgi:phosphoglycolate phosphatase
MINTVIFDLDGTLLNTLHDLTDSVNYALEQFGFPLRSVEEIRQFVGNGVKVLLDLAVPNNTPPEITHECLNLYKVHYNTNMQNKTKPYEGILDLLHNLKEMGIKLAVVSNKYDAAVKSLCKDYYSDYIIIAIGESSEVAKKPAPDSVYTALSKLDSVKEEAIYVGDSEVDVRTAHNAGVPCIGVTWGFRSREVLSREGAEMIIDTPSELITYIKSVNT